MDHFVGPWHIHGSAPMVLDKSLIDKKFLNLNPNRVWLRMSDGKKHLQSVPAWQQSLLNHLRDKMETTSQEELDGFGGNEVVGSIRFPPTIRESSKSEKSEYILDGVINLYGDGTYAEIHDMYEGQGKAQNVMMRRILFLDLYDTRATTPSQHGFDVEKSYPKDDLEYKSKWMRKEWDVYTQFEDEFKLDREALERRKRSREQERRARKNIKNGGESNGNNNRPHQGRPQAKNGGIQPQVRRGGKTQQEKDKEKEERKREAAERNAKIQALEKEVGELQFDYNKAMAYYREAQDKFSRAENELFRARENNAQANTLEGLQNNVEILREEMNKKEKEVERKDKLLAQTQEKLNELKRGKGGKRQRK